jgi:GDP-L-fucose synthase
LSEVKQNAAIFVAGHAGLVGSGIIRRLQKEGFSNILTAERRDLDLRDGASVEAWFAVHKPEYVILAAGLVGGIFANFTRPADFFYDNLMIHATVISAAHRHGVRKLLYLGSSCMYPRDCPQPIKEDYLLTGPLEQTNEAYALAKIAGVKMCESYRRQYGCDFISATPTNLYGPGDSFDLGGSHVLPALIRKFHEAKMQGMSEVVIWGTGNPRREFLHVDDLADALLFLLRNYGDSIHINVGTGEDLTIRELAETVAAIVYPTAKLTFDASKPDGTPRKLLDISRLLELGWRASVPLEAGIRSTYQWYLENPQSSTPEPSPRIPNQSFPK